MAKKPCRRKHCIVRRWINTWLEIRFWQIEARQNVASPYVLWRTLILMEKEAVGNFIDAAKNKPLDSRCLSYGLHSCDRRVRCGHFKRESVSNQLQDEAYLPKAPSTNINWISDFSELVQAAGRLLWSLINWYGSWIWIKHANKQINNY